MIQAQDATCAKHTVAILRLWPCFLFVILPFVLILWGPTGQNYRITQKLDPISGRWVDISPPHPMALYAWIIALAGWGYWLYWVYRLHQAAAMTTSNAQSVLTVKAVGLHLVPLFNLYWVFAWTAAMAKSAEQASRQRIGAVGTGLSFCLALLIAMLSLVPPGAVLANALGLGIAVFAGILFSRKIGAALLGGSSAAGK